MGQDPVALDRDGVLERPVTVDGVAVPLWRALYDASYTEDDDTHDVTTALLAGYGLAPVERLEVAIDLARGAYGLGGVDVEPLAAIVRDPDLGRWAPACADRLVHELEATGRYPGTQATVPLML